MKGNHFTFHSSHFTFKMSPVWLPKHALAAERSAVPPFRTQCSGSEWIRKSKNKGIAGTIEAKSRNGGTIMLTRLSKIFRKQKILSVCVLLLTLLLLGGCGAAGPAPNLSGKWVATAMKGAESGYFQVAVIDGDVIKTYWYFPEDGTKYLYWMGTYERPKNGKEPYSWESKNLVEEENMNRYRWLSHDSTKTFTYKKNKLSYNVKMASIVSGVALEKGKWE